MEVVFFAVGALPVFLLKETGEGRSLMEIKERLPLNGVGAERSKAVLVLSVCAMWVCTGFCASVRAAAVLVERITEVAAKAFPSTPQPGHRQPLVEPSEHHPWIGKRRWEAP